MASINMSFDTVSKNLSLSIDGKEIADVVSVSVDASYDDEDEYSCSVLTRVEDKGNDIVEYRRLSAANSKGAVGSPCNVPDFLLQINRHTDVATAIRNFLGK